MNSDLFPLSGPTQSSASAQSSRPAGPLPGSRSLGRQPGMSVERNILQWLKFQQFVSTNPPT